MYIIRIIQIPNETYPNWTCPLRFPSLPFSFLPFRSNPNANFSFSLRNQTNLSNIRIPRKKKNPRKRKMIFTGFTVLWFPPWFRHHPIMALLLSPDVSSIWGRRFQTPAGTISRVRSKSDPGDGVCKRGKRAFGFGIRVSLNVQDLEDAKVLNLNRNVGLGCVGQFSPPVKHPSSKPSKEEEEKRNYYLNTGYAIRTIREEFPALFYKELSFDIYRLKKNFIFNVSLLMILFFFLFIGLRLFLYISIFNPVELLIYMSLCDLLTTAHKWWEVYRICYAKWNSCF